MHPLLSNTSVLLVGRSPHHHFQQLCTKELTPTSVGLNFSDCLLVGEREQVNLNIRKQNVKIHKSNIKLRVFESSLLDGCSAAYRNSEE